MNVKALFDIFFSLCCSSLFFDEDGDLAHEFYEETIVTKNGHKKAKLKRVLRNLTPQVRKRWHQTRYSVTTVLLLIKILKKSFWCVAGNYKAGPSVHPCRFPSCHLWSLTTCPGSSHTSRRVNSVPWLSFSWKPELPFEISTTIFKCDVLMWTCLMLSLCMWCLGLWTDTVQVTSGRGKERCQSVDLSSLADCGLRACVFWYVCKMEPDSPEFGCCHLIFFLWFTELQTFKGKVMGSFSSHL